MVAETMRQKSKDIKRLMQRLGIPRTQAERIIQCRGENKLLLDTLTLLSKKG